MATVLTGSRVEVLLGHWLPDLTLSVVTDGVVGDLRAALVGTPVLVRVGWRPLVAIVKDEETVR